MEDVTVIMCGSALLSLFIASLFLYLVRDTNVTKKFISTQKEDRKIFVSKLELEGKKYEISSQEKIEQGKRQSEMEARTLDSGKHQATISCKLSKQDKKLEEVTFVQSAILRSTELKCQTAKDLSSMNLDFKKTRLQSEESRFLKSLEFEDKHKNQDTALEYKKIKLQGKMAELTANTDTYIADKNLKGRMFSDQVKFSRVELKCKTQLDLGKEALSVERERQSGMLRLGEKQIASQETCFREQLNTTKAIESLKIKSMEKCYRESAKTERLRLSNSLNPVNMLGSLVQTGVGAVLGATPQGRTAGVMLQGISSGLGNGTTIEELPD